MTKNVLITGGSRGIGFGIAKELAKLGCNLVINGVREQEKVVGVVQDLKKYGTEIVYCQGDIASPEDRDKIFKTSLDYFKQLHVLVNNAGVAPKKRVDLLEMTQRSYSWLMGINLEGPFFLTQKIARHMIENKSSNSSYEGCIINLSSISATMASTQRGEYCLSKAGISMMTKLFATRLGEHNIPVYEVRPGIIETDMTAAVIQKYLRLVEDGLTIESRLGSPEDVGKAVSSLVSGNLPYATGQVIMVDGGLSVPRI